MKIEIHTNNANGLWAKIKRDITTDKIKTWTVVLNDKKEEFLTHTPQQWFKKALLKPSVAANPYRLVMTIDWFTDSVPNEYTKGLYIGRFTEELLEHYKFDWSRLETFA